jgi:hypothetical protein
MPKCTTLRWHADGPQLAQLPLSQATQLQTLTLIDTHSRVQPLDLSPAAGLTNLTSLHYTHAFCLGITALTTLTALTQLSILPHPAGSAARHYAKPTAQSALAAALPALASLKQLSLPYVQPEPLTDALSQLTSLTQLTLWHPTGISRATRLRLPTSLHVLELPWVDVSVLCGIITAPNLHHVTVSARLKSGQEAEFKQLSEGLLQHCADLSASGRQGMSEKDMLGLMTVLKSTWKPTGAARARHADHLRRRHVMNHKDSLAWGLRVFQVACTQAVLQQVPPGITHLELR